MKRLLLFFAVMCCMMVANAEDFTVDGIKYNVTSTENNTVEVVMKGRIGSDFYEGDIVIPATVTNNDVTYSVTSIGNDAFAECISLTSITLPSGVTSIGNYAFYHCSSLSSITLPNGVTSIGDNAFQGCSSLASINIPNGVTSIGNSAFAECSSLTDIILPDKLESLGMLSFRVCKSLAYVIFQGTTPPSLPGDSYYYPFKDSGKNVEGGSTKLYVPNDDAVTAYEAAGYTNVFSFDELKSKALDEIATAMKDVTLTPDDAAIVTACKETIKQTTDIGTILQKWGNALSVINLQKAKDAAIAEIDDALDGYADITEEEKETLEEYRSNISNATSVSQVNAAKKEAMEIIWLIQKRLAKEDLSWCYAEVTKYVNLEPYFDEIDNATTMADIDEIVKKAKSELDEALKGTLIKDPYFVIGDKWYLASISGYTYPYNGSISFQDGVSYQARAHVFITGEGSIFEYNRTLPEGVWQCWYEPFEVTVDTERFDVAEVAGILTNAQGETVVAFNKLENGVVMKPNTIYVIRAKKGHGKLNIIPNSNYLYPSTETTLTIQSAYDNYTLTGNYSPVEHGDWYTLDKTGAFRQMADGSLKPQRFYLTITPRTDAYYPKKTAASAPPFIRMTVLGDDDDETTGIETIDDGQLTIDNSQLYDLQGRKVTSIQKGQIYIVNGKKYIAK